MVKGKKSYTEGHIIYVHLHEMSRAGKSTETESRLAVARGRGEKIMKYDY